VQLLVEPEGGCTGVLGCWGGGSMLDMHNPLHVSIGVATHPPPHLHRCAGDSCCCDPSSQATVS
jgi:hypothetical protein